MSGVFVYVSVSKPTPPTYHIHPPSPPFLPSYIVHIYIKILVMIIVCVWGEGVDKQARRVYNRHADGHADPTHTGDLLVKESV